ncbi:MAG: gliding motility-associated-like protein [Crocinitomicaceae bacterium]|jgi:gliding motility-associated-like protein
MKSSKFLLKGVLCLAFLSLTLSSSAADFYWTGALSNEWNNIGNWSGIGGSASPQGSDGNYRPWTNDNVFFVGTVANTSINCTGGNCLNVNLTDATSAVYTFNNNLNVFGSINSPLGKLIMGLGSKIVFDGAGVKTIQLSNTYVASNYIKFEFKGSGSYSVVESLKSFGNSGVFTLSGNALVNSNGNELLLNTIKFIAPAVSSSLILDGSNVILHEGIFYGEWNGTLPPGPGVSVSAQNTTLELCVIYNNTIGQSLSNVERILFRSGTSYPVRSAGNVTIQSDSVYVDANAFGAYGIIDCNYFELLRPTAISGNIASLIKYNDFIVPSNCAGSSSLNFDGAAATFSFENTSGITKNIDMLFKNVDFLNSPVNSSNINDQGGNGGLITWTASLPGLTFHWLGGSLISNDWNNPENWSISGSGGSAQTSTGCIPTLSDIVYFDGNYTSTDDVTNTFTTPLFSKEVYWTDPLNTIGILGAAGQLYKWHIAGSADLSGMNTTIGAKAHLYMIGGPGFHTFDPAAMAYPRGVWFNGTGSYTLQNDLTVQTLSHGQGVLNTNGNAVTCLSGSFGSGFDSQALSPASLRELNISNSIINIYAGGIDSGGMVAFDATNSEINLTSPTSSFRFNGGLNTTLASMVLPKVSFTSATGTPLFLYGSSVISITEMNLASNLSQKFGTIKVGTLNLTGGTTISLQGINIGTAVNVSGSVCGDIVSIKSNVSGTQGNLYKPTGTTFTIDRAYMKDINASLGLPLTVTDGIDGGNNTNVTIGAGISRDFYWVGNSGDYNDGDHWSIGFTGGTGGAAYPTSLNTNPTGCIPTALDNVFFDNNSFDATGQTVNIPIDANCKNMNWTGSGTWTPLFTGGSVQQMNVYGSLILEGGLTWTHSSRVNMLGNETTLNSQIVDFDGVTLSGSIFFQGGGRYDIQSDLNILGLAGTGYNTGSFFLQAGNVYSNGFDIEVSSMRLYLNVAANYFDAANSTITSNYVWNTHGATVNYDFTNSTIVNTTGAIGVLIGTLGTVNYGNFLLGGTSLTTNGTVVAQSVTRTAAITTTAGNWTMDTLILAKSSENSFQAGSTITVNDTLIAFGTPCIPVILKANSGTATYESTSLNTFIQFGSLQNMVASLAGGGSATDYQVIGADVGGNLNWTFTPTASLPYLGAYTVSENCDALPVGVTTAGFSPVSGSTYLWSTGSTAPSIGLDTAGVYSVAVTYAPGCTVTDSIDFSIVNTMDIQSSSVMPSCFEDSTGTISTTILGGNNNFDYTWMSPTGNTFTINAGDSTQLSDLVAGDYQVIVNQTNNPACADTLTIAITEPTLLSPDLALTNLACNSDTDGAILATGNGGTPGYQVSIDGGGFNPAPFNFSGLAAGNYEIVVQDFNGCLDTLIQSIIEPTLLVASGSNTDVLCNGDSNGSVGLTVNGGTPTYDVSVNGGAFAPYTGTYGGLTAGNYELIVEDQNGCRDTINQTIIEPAVLATNATITSNYNGLDISCNGLTDGSISSLTNGGTVNYSYSWNTTPVQTTPNLTGVGAGSYTLTVTDDNGCVTQSSVTLTEPSLLTTSGTATTLLCNADSDGAITVTSTGGTPAYQASVNGGAFNPPPFNYTGLTAGTYDIVVQDINGCSDTLNLAVTEPTALVATATSSSLLCNGDSNGSVDLTVNGGIPTYDVSVNGGAFAPYTGTYGGLTAGNYELIVEDQNGCRDTINQTIIEPAVLATNATITSNYNGLDISCNGSTDGSISSLTNGGTVNYSYSWNTTPVQTTPNLTGVGAGSYTLTVTDDNGCIAQSSVTLAEPAVLSDTYTVDQSANCNVADGAATVTTLGGTPTYTYVWSNNPGNTSNSATDLAAGITNVIITDANGCTDNIAITINSINAPLPYLSADSVLCLGENTGTAFVDSVSGNGGYTYIWLDDLGNPIGQVNATATGLAAGTYSVQVTDLNGCSATQTINVDEPLTSVVVSVLDVSSPDCYASDEGSITVSASGGTGTIEYSWNTTPIQTTPSITNLPGGTYTVTATDENGCFIEEDIQITVPTALALTSVQTGVSCFDGSDGEITVTTQGGTPTYNYAWTGSPSTSNLATNLVAGNYTVVVSDSNGCLDSLSLVVSEPTVLEGEIISSTEPDCGGSNGSVTIDVTGGTGTYSFLWNDGNTSQNLPTAQSGLNSVLITDQNGCTQTLEIDLSCSLFEIPELLTPNGDAKNDLWAIPGLENYPNTDVQIFNRWGTKVFASDDYQNDWNGTSQSKLNVGGDQLPESSYYYILTLGGSENDPNAGGVYKGYIYIKRN